MIVQFILFQIIFSWFRVKTITLWCTHTWITWMIEWSFKLLISVERTFFLVICALVCCCSWWQLLFEARTLSQLIIGCCPLVYCRYSYFVIFKFILLVVFSFLLIHLLTLWLLFNLWLDTWYSVMYGRVSRIIRRLTHHLNRHSCTFSSSCCSYSCRSSCWCYCCPWCCCCQCCCFCRYFTYRRRHPVCFFSWSCVDCVNLWFNGWIYSSEKQKKRDSERMKRNVNKSVSVRWDEREKRESSGSSRKSLLLLLVRISSVSLGPSPTLLQYYLFSFVVRAAFFLSSHSLTGWQE